MIAGEYFKGRIKPPAMIVLLVDNFDQVSKHEIDVARGLRYKGISIISISTGSSTRKAVDIVAGKHSKSFGIMDFLDLSEVLPEVIRDICGLQ